jgi:hypothetical protein
VQLPNPLLAHRNKNQLMRGHCCIPSPITCFPLQIPILAETLLNESRNFQHQNPFLTPFFLLFQVYKYLTSTSQKGQSKIKLRNRHSQHRSKCSHTFVQKYHFSSSPWHLRSMLKMAIVIMDPILVSMVNFIPLLLQNRTC